jgi:hypothetical protein
MASGNGGGGAIVKRCSGGDPGFVIPESFEVLFIEHKL